MSEKVSFVEVMIGILSALAVVALHAWSISVLWLWFVVPIGVTPIGIVHAMGISVLVNSAGGSMPSNKQERSMTALIVSGAAEPFIALAVGWCLHAFM